MSNTSLNQALTSFINSWNATAYTSGRLSLVKKKIKFNCLFAIFYLKKGGVSSSIIYINEGSMSSVPYREIHWDNGIVYKSKKVLQFSSILRRNVRYITDDGLEHSISY